jgi:hypothetical protein
MAREMIPLRRQGDCNPSICGQASQVLPANTHSPGVALPAPRRRYANQVCTRFVAQIYAARHPVRTDIVQETRMHHASVLLILALCAIAVPGAVSGAVVTEADVTYAAQRLCAVPAAPEARGVDSAGRGLKVSLDPAADRRLFAATVRGYMSAYQDVLNLARRALSDSLRADRSDQIDSATAAVERARHAAQAARQRINDLAKAACLAPRHAS